MRMRVRVQSTKAHCAHTNNTFIPVSYICDTANAYSTCGTQSISIDNRVNVYGISIDY